MKTPHSEKLGQEFMDQHWKEGIRSMYRFSPLTEFSHNELIAIINEMGMAYQNQHKDHMHDLDMLGK